MRRAFEILFFLFVVFALSFTVGCASRFEAENPGGPAEASAASDLASDAGADLQEPFESEKTERQDVESTLNELLTDAPITNDMTEETTTEITPAHESLNNVPLSGRIIVLDPGHGRFPENYQERLAPWSEETKKAFSTGTAGRYMSEAELVLKLALMLKPRLEELGAVVYMTREDENSISNIARAEFANELKADLAFRIHADGNDDSAVCGMSMLVPAKGTLGDELEKISRSYGETILASMIENTGAKDRGVRERGDLTGFNWSIVPVVLVECGFMSNPEEDALLSDETYQEKLVKGMLEGILNCFS